MQREISEDVRSSAFAVSETLNQLSRVTGGLAGVLVSMLDNGQAGLGITAACLAVAMVYLTIQRRQRIRASRAHRAPPQAHRHRSPPPAAGTSWQRDQSARAGPRRAAGGRLGRRVDAGERPDDQREPSPAAGATAGITAGWP